MRFGRRVFGLIVTGGLWLTLAAVPRATLRAEDGSTGNTVFSGYKGESPGTLHKITVADLPAPYATQAVDHGAHLVAQPAGAWPKAPAGFEVQKFAEKLENPRLLRTAPNGDVFLAESEPGRILVFRGIGKDGRAASTHVFAAGFTLPFGIAFYPLGSNPNYIYIANANSVVRYPYHVGDLAPSGPQEVVIPQLPGFGRLRGGGHWTRDIVISPDCEKLFVSVGSLTNVSDVDNNPGEFHRADVLIANPDGSDLRVYASGIRNPVGLAVSPRTGELWASVNERDQLGDNLPPDYITHVQEGGFYGWPWYYIGPHQDPRFEGKHPELRDKVIVPDVLVQPHNASLELTFYEGKQFPSQYTDNIFAAEHGSWNRDTRTGYEVIRVPMKDGRATGGYEDFLTGFVTPEGDVWGRPVGVAVAADGSLLVSDDGGNCIWRVSYTGSPQ